jgi:hypothetical protein
MFDPIQWAKLAHKKWSGEALQRNLKAIPRLERAVKYARRRGLVVKFVHGSTGFIDNDAKVVVVPKHSSFEHILYVLLHELGHHKSLRYKVSDRRIDILEEEMNAWRLAWDLGAKLGVLTVENLSTFNRAKSRALMTYVRWAAGDVTYVFDHKRYERWMT